MSPLAGPFFAAAAVLALAGASKVLQPAATRVALRSVGLPSSAGAVRAIGLGEIAVAGAVVGMGGPVPTLALALTYIGFAGFAQRLRRVGGADVGCGCFGDASAPVTMVHVAVNLVVAAVAAVTLLDPVPHLVDAMARTPAGGWPFVVLVAGQAWLLVVVLTVVPRAQAGARVAAGSRRGPGTTTPAVDP